MILTDELRGIIAKRGYSQRKVASMIGITEKTFYEKMKKGVFNSAEIQAMMEFLEIDDPKTIFCRKNFSKRYKFGKELITHERPSPCQASAVRGNDRGLLWRRARQLLYDTGADRAALGYSKPQKAIDNIHKRRKGRLERYSVPLKLRGTDGKEYATVVYSAKGIYEFCRHSDMPVADAFYDAVYEVLEGLRMGYLSLKLEQATPLWAGHASGLQGGQKG